MDKTPKKSSDRLRKTDLCLELIAGSSEKIPDVRETDREEFPLGLSPGEMSILWGEDDPSESAL